MVKGKAVATWSLKAGKVALTPFHPINRNAQKALDAEADAVMDYLG